MNNVVSKLQPEGERIAISATAASELRRDANGMLALPELTRRQLQDLAAEPDV